MWDSNKSLWIHNLTEICETDSKCDNVDGMGKSVKKDFLAELVTVISYGHKEHSNKVP